MKRRIAAAVLAAVLSVSMVAGTAFAADSTVSRSGTESEVSVTPEDRTWDLASDSTAVREHFEGTTGEFAGIQIDATKGKFGPTENYTQINANTVLKIPVSANSNGAVLSIQLAGGTSEVRIDGVTYTDVSQIELPAAAEDTVCTVSFIATSSYVSSISLTYKEPGKEYPGTPENVTAEDKEYTFESAEGLLDENGNPAADNKLEGIKGTFSDMKVDASNGKFNILPDRNQVQIAEGTVLYIPVAYDAEGAELLIAGTIDGNIPSEITVNGKSAHSNEAIQLDMSDASAYPQYVKAEFPTMCYATSISVNYASDSDYGTPSVEAKDKTWDFTESSTVERPAVEKTKGEFDGIQIDAVTGKFNPRTAASGGSDTQVTGGTTLYIPVAPDAEGASITISGNNYNNLTLTLDGTEVTVGKETALPAVEENTYLPLEFSGDGSCYLTGITVDYMSDNMATANTVTVGAGGTYDYATIQAALDANDSSASNPLVLLIAPGTYTEKVTVDKPYVSFQPLYKDGGEIVIEESYYSSNTFDQDGTFLPQDDYDLGTDQCGTVLLTANATGFSASGITFQNSYNVEDHTGAGEQTPAVAFGSVADKVYLKDCRFIGRQDTLYLHGSGSRVQVENCYIEGTVDFVFGDANAYFTGCDLHMAAFAGRDSGYFTAANTKKGNVGFVFSQCNLTVDSSYANSGKVSLGRPWQTEIYTESARDEKGNTYVTVADENRKNPAYENTSSAVTFIECTMDPSIQSERWNVWTRKNAKGKTIDVTYHDDVRFAEINSEDASGSYLDPEDYQNIVLGTMTVTEDAQAQLDQMLGEMGFGSGVGNWDPSFDDHSGTVPGENPGETPGQNPGETPEQNPGVVPGEGTETGNNGSTGSGTTGNTGTVSGNAGNTSADTVNGSAGNSADQSATAAENGAVRTGDTTGLYFWIVCIIAAAVVVAGAVCYIRRRKAD